MENSQGVQRRMWGMVHWGEGPAEFDLKRRRPSRLSLFKSYVANKFSLCTDAPSYFFLFSAKGIKLPVPNITDLGLPRAVFSSRAVSGFHPARG